MKFNFREFLRTQTHYLNLIDEIYNSKSIVYPPKDKIFATFENFDYDNLKIVIVGQDPYYLPNMANGLAFSCDIDKTPMSLKNIFTEIKKDYPNTNFETNDLTYWKNQGVLLVNSSLTVEAYNPMSHKKYNWDTFVINLLNKINKHYSHIIYVAFGNVAKNLLRQVNLSNQYAIATSHPSPLGYAQGFKDSHIFKKINDKLISLKKTTIDWSTKISEKK